MPLLFTNLAHFKQNICHFCSSTLHKFNTPGWNGRYPDIAPTAILGLCKTVKVPETARMETVKRQSVECGFEEVNGSRGIWLGQAIERGTQVGWTITQAAIEARDESKAKSVEHSTPDRQY